MLYESALSETQASVGTWKKDSVSKFRIERSLTLHVHERANSSGRIPSVIPNAGLEELCTPKVAVEVAGESARFGGDTLLSTLKRAPQTMRRKSGRSALGARHTGALKWRKFGSLLHTIRFADAHTEGVDTEPLCRAQTPNRTSCAWPQMSRAEDCAVSPCGANGRRAGLATLRRAPLHDDHAMCAHG